MATGIAVCGSGMGQIIVPIIANQILEVYSWRTSFQAMGAGILICGLAGLAFRPNKPQRINLLQRMKKERDEQRRWNSDLEINEISMSKIKEPLPGIEEEDLSIISTEETPKQINDIPNGSLETNEIMKSESSLIEGVKISNTEYPLIDKPPVEVVVESQNVVKSKEEQDLEKKKEMLNSSVLSLVMSVSSLAEGKVSFMDYMKDLFDPVLLLDVRFILLALSGFFTSASMITTYTFIVDYAVNVGIDHNSAAFLISIIGITNTAGRVILGMASDCKNISALWLNNGALLLGGVGVICWPYYNTHLWFLLMAGIFGASIGKNELAGCIGWDR
ncbi:Mct1 [Cordylochernes scorpioides]|uniref:Mct1 n=1 Tax=Cordylochernes scorpioides TaxID=51811 RepID=A0ABY6L0R1_9ARAC|nr:Mct1 [Cordylochernes scorpioides]